MPVDDKWTLDLKPAIGDGGVWNIYGNGVDARGNKFYIVQDDPYIFGSGLYAPGKNPEATVFYHPVFNGYCTPTACLRDTRDRLSCRNVVGIIIESRMVPVV